MSEDAPIEPASINQPDPQVVIFVGLALLSGALYFDYAAIKDVAAQLRATRYAVTEGVITSSRETTDPHSDGLATHGIAVSYTYDVQGRGFVGDHYYADDDWGSSSGDWAEQIVRGLPPGARVPVYYPPDAPARAVLRPGVTGGQLLMAMLAVLVTLIPISVIVGARRKKRGIPDPRESDVAKRELEIPTPVAPFRALFAALSPLGAATMALGISAMLALFFIVAVFGSHPSLGVPVAAWSLIAAAAVAAYRYASAKSLTESTKRGRRPPG